MEATCLALSDIIVDSEIQQRVNGLDPATVNDYAEKYENGVEMPPVVAFQDKDESIYLADGFHRYAAQELLGRESIDVDLRKGTRRDAILFACAANSSHGLRRTNADKRKAITTLLKDATWAKRSDRWIADKVGVGHQLVGDARKQLDDSSSSQPGGGEGDEDDEDEPAATVGRDGKKRRKRKSKATNGSAVDKPKGYPAWESFQQYMMNLAGIQDGLLAKYDRSVSRMVESGEWDTTRTVMALNYLDESIKAFQSLRKELAKHVG